MTSNFLTAVDEQLDPESDGRRNNSFWKAFV